MAFSKQPTISTYQTKRITLAAELDTRNASVDKDAQFLNVFFEPSKMEKIVHLIKRSGASAFGSVVLPTFAVRGIHYWEDQNKIFVANSDDVIVINATTGALITILTTVFGTSTGEVGFTEFLYDDTSVKVVATDGTTLVTIDSANTVVAAADADMPVHLPQPVFLDGYLFVIKASSADIYNSNLNNPLAWTAGDFISVEMFPDTVVRLAKLNNYLVVFGSASIEYFWDAANASGSPLQRNDTPVKLTGFLGGYAQYGNKIFFIGNADTGLPEIYYLEDFKITPIGEESVRRYLGSITAILSTAIGNVVSFSGHDFYVINIGDVTYVHDIKMQNWVHWAWQAESNFDLEQAVVIKSGTTYATLAYFTGGDVLYKFSDTLYQDALTNFTVEAVTPLQMFDSYNRKTMHRCTVIGDRPTANSNISISWSDDDYQTWVTARTTNLNSEIPSIYQLGQFRRRAMKLSYTDNYPLRIHELEVDINLGNT